jgi:uncharacterized protein (DUF697 family)
VKFPIKPLAIWGIAREIRTASEDVEPLVVAGAADAAGRLVEAFRAGAEPAFVLDLSGRELTRDEVEGANVLVYAIEGETPSDADERTLRLADRHDVDPVCVHVRERPNEPRDIPYVLATDVIAVAPGEELPLKRIAARVAARVGDDGYLLASKVPALRHAICEHIVRHFSRQNGVLAAAIFIPGADFPVLMLNQIRMVLRLAAAHGEEIGARRALELLPLLGAGLGFREVARQAVGFVPVLGWAIQGGIALAGTRAVGEAAIVYFEALASRQHKNVVRSRS